MSRRARRGSASDASQQEGEPPADELGGESATALLLSKLAEVTGQLTELQSERSHLGAATLFVVADMRGQVVIRWQRGMRLLMK